MRRGWLDSDVTVKVLDGRQEGAVKGDNPHQPGRPSPTDPTDYIANLRRILDVAVPPGNPTASAPSAPGRWALLGRLPRAHGPVFMRGDRDGGTPANRARAAPEGVDYRFQWRLTPGVQTTLERLMRDAHWTAAGQGGQGAETRLRLTGWHRARRAIVLRRRVKADLAAVDAGHPGQ